MLIDISKIPVDRLLKLPVSEQLIVSDYIRDLNNPKDTTFRTFIKDYWSILEPNNPFIDNWTVGALSEHLTACYEREIQRLIINIYFRSAKSSITSVLFPAWCWTRNASERFLCASFASDLAMRDADHSKMLMESQKFKGEYGRVFQMRSGQSAKGYYENNKMGSRRSISTNSTTTGYGGSIKILDDPNDVKKTESKTTRDATNEWFSKSWSSRSDNFTNDVSIIIQQRTHKQDVTGYCIERDLGYELLKIPLVYEGKKYFTSIGWSDPREEIGEVADKQRFPPKVVAELKRVLHVAYYGQAQQEPQSPEGDVIKREWYPMNYSLPIHVEDVDGVRVYTKGAEVVDVCGYVDLAGSDNPNSDRTAMNVKIKLSDGRIVKLWQHSGRWTPKTRNIEIGNFYSAWNKILPQMRIFVESNNILGEHEMKMLRNQLLGLGLNVRMDRARISKVDRAVNQKDSYRANAEANMIEFYVGDLFPEIVKLYGAPSKWVAEFFEESCALRFSEDGTKFEGDHVDLLDDDVGCFNKLTASRKLMIAN